MLFVLQVKVIIEVLPVMSCIPLSELQLCTWSILDWNWL